MHRLIVGLVLAGVVAGDAEATPAEVKTKLKAHFGRKLARIRPANSALLQQHLPGHEAFEVTLRTGRRAAIAGPAHYEAIALIERASGAVVKRTAVDALLTKKEPKIAAELYAALHHLTIVSARGELQKLCRIKRAMYPARERRIGPVTVIGKSGKRTVTFFALSDRSICSVSKISLRWSAGGKLRVSTKRFSWRGGYR